MLSIFMNAFPTVIRTAIVPIACMLITVFSTGCEKSPTSIPSPSRGAEAVPVTEATVASKNMPVALRVFGSVEANSTVTLKSQITGVLTNVLIREGQAVKQGDLLLLIDCRTEEATIKQLEANLSRARAQRDNAAKELQRQKELRTKGVSSEDDYDQAQTAFRTLAAVVEAEEAALEKARIEASYCAIRAPFDGCIGGLLSHQGDLVKANDMALLTLNQIRPIKANFSVPQDALPEIRRRMAGGPLAVTAYVPGSPDNVETGQLVFINNEVDTRTGTIQLKGLFANADERLWPGQFIHVILTLNTQSNAIVAPSSALLTGQDGTYAFVLKPDNTVESRTVKVARVVGEESVIADGLKAGERVVTDGQLRLVTGTRASVAATNRHTSAGSALP